MKKLILSICLFVSFGCIDRFHEPGIISKFSYEVTVIGKISNINFNYTLPPGAFLGEMVAGRTYEEITVFNGNQELYTVKQEDLNEMLVNNPYKNVIWKLSESGVDLISIEEAQRINKELFKPNKRKRENEKVRKGQSPKKGQVELTPI